MEEKEKKEFSVLDDLELEVKEEYAQTVFDARIHGRYGSEKEALKASRSLSDLLKTIDSSSLSKRDRIVLNSVIKALGWNIVEGLEEE